MVQDAVLSGGAPAVGSSLADRIRTAVVGGEVVLPPLPEIAVRLRDLLGDENTDARTVADLVRSDPAVSAALLRAANSAAFGGLRELRDISQAVARLGLRRVGSIVDVVVHRGRFESKDPSRHQLLRALWDHAIVTAIAARRIASAVGVDGVEEAFLAGLLHDTGRLMVLKGIDLLGRGPEEDVTDVVSRELMTLLHEELGEAVLVSWKMPALVTRAARHHHDPSAFAEDRGLDAVRLACAAARKLGAHTDPAPDLNLLDLDAAERLGLDDLRLATLIIDTEDSLAEVRTLF